MWRHMARVCIRHPFLLSENLCGRCGAEFCRECLVFPRGQKLPMCVTCAIRASGVRSNATPGVSKREIRARAKARYEEIEALAPPALPEIANPVPAGWAFAETDELAGKAGPTGRRTGRRRPRGTAEWPAAEKKAVANKPAVKTNDVKTNEPSDMMSWLDSVYSTD